MNRLTILTDRQKTELNKAVLQYIEPFIESSQLEAIKSRLTPLDNAEIPSDYLERKWSTVAKLQKTVMDLRDEVVNLKERLNAQGLNQQVAVLQHKIDWLPQVKSKKFDIPNAQVVNLVVIHPYLPQINAGCADGTIIAWNIVDDELNIPSKVIRAHTNAINSLAWSWMPIEFPKKPKTPIIALCSADLLIKIWDGNTFANLRTLAGHEHTILLVAWLKLRPEILYLVLRDRTVKVWDVVSGTCIKLFTGHLEWVRDIDVTSIDGNWLSQLEQAPPLKFGDFIVTCSNDQLVRLSHAELGTGIAQLLGHTHVVETVKFLPVLSNPYLDKFLEDNINGFPNIPIELITSPVYTKELGYKYCISGGRDNLIKIWLLPPPEIVPHRPPQTSKTNDSKGWLIAELNEHSLWVKSLSIHPLGRFIFSGSDDKLIKIWDLAGLESNGKTRSVRTLLGHENFVNSIDFARVNVELDQIEVGDDAKAALLSHMEVKLRRWFVLAGLDSLVYLWT